MRRDFRYTGIHNIQNNLKFRRNFRWKAGLPLKKIRIQRVSVFDIAVTLLLAVVIIALAVRGTRELAKMKTTTGDYIQCETLARRLQSGSDYLVEQVRMYTATGQREYMDNYFEEVNVTRRRETALEYFEENYGDTDAFSQLKSAMMTSQNLSCTDRYAMRLIAEATLADSASWPAEIQAVSLHDSDLAMSDAEQMRKAQQLVCNSQYQNMRNDVTNKVTEGIESLTELIRSNQGRAATIFTDIYRKIELSAANLLTTTFRSIDYICRIGGDEFAVIMVDVNQGLSYTVSDKIKIINDALFNPADGLPAVSLSVGVAFTDRENPGQSIFKDADQALYQVKQNGRHGCGFY